MIMPGLAGAPAGCDALSLGACWTCPAEVTLLSPAKAGNAAAATHAAVTAIPKRSLLRSLNAFMDCPPLLMEVPRCGSRRPWGSRVRGWYSAALGMSIRLLSTTRLIGPSSTLTASPADGSVLPHRPNQRE